MRAGRRDEDDGFTLVELLVVIIIIGILAAIAVPVFLNQRQKAKDASAKSDLRSLSLAMESYNADKGTYPTTRAQVDGAGLTPRTSPSTKVAILVADADGYCLAATNEGGSRSAANPFTGTTIYYWDSRAGGLRKLTEGCPSYPAAAGVNPSEYWPS